MEPSKRLNKRKSFSNRTTRDETNLTILNRLRGDDPSLESVWIRRARSSRSDEDYISTHLAGRDLRWLSKCIGNNTAIKKLVIAESNQPCLGLFVKRIATNKSIDTIELIGLPLHQVSGLSWLYPSERVLFKRLGQFIKKNGNITSLNMTRVTFSQGGGIAHLIDAMERTNSLSQFQFSCNNLKTDNAQVPRLISALSHHRGLSSIKLGRVGPCVCNEFARILRHMSSLRVIDLSDSGIDNGGLTALIESISSSDCNPAELDLSDNSPNISEVGWQKLASYLACKTCELTNVSLSLNKIAQDDIIELANCLQNNPNLVSLEFRNIRIGCETIAFEKALGHHSSPNEIFKANHRLRHLGRRVSIGMGLRRPSMRIGMLNTLLDINRTSLNVDQAAITKILLLCDELDMAALLEYDLKLLPNVVNWFDDALKYVCCMSGLGITRRRVFRMKLHAIHTFITRRPALLEDSKVGTRRRA